MEGREGRTDREGWDRDGYLPGDSPARPARPVPRAAGMYTHPASQPLSQPMVMPMPMDITPGVTPRCVVVLNP